MNSKWSFTILRVWGIPIKLHISMILIIPLMNWDFGWVAAVLLGVGMFACITLHELGHCYVAMRKGSRVREILLLPIGGVAQMESIPRRPMDELLMAGAGPAVSFALFLLLFFGGLYAPLSPIIFAGEAPHVVHLNALQLLGLTNLGWVVFNLIPAFPMDGGRILRAWLTRRLGRLRATFVAATIGKAGAVVLGLAGYRYGIWTLILIAIFIYWAAGQELRTVERQEKMHGYGVDPFGSPDPDHLDPDHNVVIGPPPYESGDKTQIAAPIIRDRSRFPFSSF